MVTDVLSKGTELLVAGDVAGVARDVRRAGARQHDRAPRRDEPQEAGRAEAAGDVVMAEPHGMTAGSNINGGGPLCEELVLYWLRP